MVRSFHQTYRGIFLIFDGEKCHFLEVNLQKLIERIALLKDQLLITKFVGPKPLIQHMKLWIQALNKELRGNSLTLCRERIFFLSGDDKDVLYNALMCHPSNPSGAHA